MAKHKHGSMDTSEQERTFDAFMRYVTRAVIGIVVLLLLIALING